MELDVQLILPCLSLPYIICNLYKQHFPKVYVSFIAFANLTTIDQLAFLLHFPNEFANCIQSISLTECQQIATECLPTDLSTGGCAAGSSL